MAETEEKLRNDTADVDAPKKRRWVVPTITTLIGVVVSLLVAWYQINLSQEQALEAERERTKSVKNELVQIVEEHIINQKPLDVSRLARLAEFRAKQESLLVIPTVSEVVENAEFNILKSQYLEFEKKQQFKEIFDGIYSELSIPVDLKYSGMFENTVNDIYASLQKSNTKDVSAKVSKLVADFNSKISELEPSLEVRKIVTLNDFVRIIAEKPTTLAIAGASYGVILYIAIFLWRRTRRRRLVEREVYQQILRDKREHEKEAMREMLRREDSGQGAE